MIDLLSSKQTLMLYSTLQEELMESPDFQSDYATSPSWNIAKSFFSQAVNRLRGKMRIPMDSALRKEDQRAFDVYRRDAGEVMVTAYAYRNPVASNADYAVFT